MKNILEFWVVNTNGAILFRKTKVEETEMSQYFGCFLSALDTFVSEMGSEHIIIYETPSFVYFLDYDNSCEMKLIFVIKTRKNTEPREVFQQKLEQFKAVFLKKNRQNLANWNGEVDIFGNSEEILSIFQTNLPDDEI